MTSGRVVLSLHVKHTNDVSQHGNALQEVQNDNPHGRREALDLSMHAGCEGEVGPCQSCIAFMKRMTELNRMNTQRITEEVLPITPAEALSQHHLCLPEEVIMAFNELILMNFKSDCAIVTQSEALAMIVSKVRSLQNTAENPITENGVLQARWLNIEDMYRARGWDVSRSFCGHTGKTEECFLFKAPWYNP
jgi:hypothetical protein